MPHWIKTYMTKEEFEEHTTAEWCEPNYKGDDGPIEIENKLDPSIKITLVNTRKTVGRNRISLEREEDGSIEELEGHSYPLDQQSFSNVIEWLEHFCQKSGSYV